MTTHAPRRCSERVNGRRVQPAKQAQQTRRREGCELRPAAISPRSSRPRGLELWFGGREEANSKIADVVPVLEGKLFPKVRHLGIRNCELVTDLVRLLPSRKLAKQLETLDLSMGTMCDEDAGELAQTAAQFPALKTLNVDDSYLTSDGLRALKAAFKGKKIVSSDQRAPDDDDEEGDADAANRYASVTE